jgi:hypothetical protein
MNPIAAKPSVQNESGFFRRFANRFCEARMEYVRQELQHQRLFLDAVGGPIGLSHAKAEKESGLAVASRPLPGMTNANRLSSPHYTMPDPSPSAAVGANVIPFHPNDGEGHQHRMFQNLVAAAWVGTLMTSAYYVFSTLLAVS